MKPHDFATVLAIALLAGDQSDAAAVARLRLVARGRQRDLLRLVGYYRALAPNGVAPRRREVARQLRALFDAQRERGAAPWVRARTHVDVPLLAPVMRPSAMRTSAIRAAPAHPWDPTPRERPDLATVGALASWLELPVEELLWFADCRDLNRRHSSPSLRHYHVSTRPKRHGGVRVTEAPQTRLKAIQRKILSEILDTIPLYYSAAHGFVKGRSVRSFAAEHVGKPLLLRIDLADFFPTVSGARVQALFRTLGYPEAVADLLGGLCTTTTPRHVFGAVRAQVDRRMLQHAMELYTRPHLPQGAPTSPALANACAFRLDARLTGLADWAGAVYSRYADDLAFSGGDEFARRIDRFCAEVGAIARAEGWRVQDHKTRIMRRGARQQVAGVVVNERLSTPRVAYEQLKATLTNCVRFGPASQNRAAVVDFRAHLLGRMAWVASLHAARGRKLHAIFDRISW